MFLWQPASFGRSNSARERNSRYREREPASPTSSWSTSTCAHRFSIAAVKLQRLAPSCSPVDVAGLTTRLSLWPLDDSLFARFRPARSTSVSSTAQHCPRPYPPRAYARCVMPGIRRLVWLARYPNWVGHGRYAQGVFRISHSCETGRSPMETERVARFRADKTDERTRNNRKTIRKKN